MPNDRDLESSSAVMLIGALAYLGILLGCGVAYWVLRGGL